MVGATLLAVAGCGGDPEFADWTLPVPEGVALRSHVVPALDERALELELERELVLGGRPGDPHDDFFRPIDLAVDDDANVYVFDGGHREIRVFDAAGEWLMTLGGEGRGPGEIDGGGRVAVAGEHVVHVGQGRLSVWDRQGTLLAAPAYTFTRYTFFPAGSVDDAALVGTHGRTDRTGRWIMAVRVSLEGKVDRTYARLPDPGLLMLRRGRYAVNTLLPRPRPTAAVSPSGDVYVTAGDEYQVSAYRPDGTPRWRMRAAWERMPVTGERIEVALQDIREISRRHAGGMPVIDDPRVSEVEWPGFLPALAGSPTAHPTQAPILVDGHGHLLVFPFVPDRWEDRRRPVDVYSRKGEPLFSGLVPMIRWDAVHGDRVWSLEEDPITAEYRVVRYRLVEPFGGDGAESFAGDGAEFSGGDGAESPGGDGAESPGGTGAESPD